MRIWGTGGGSGVQLEEAGSGQHAIVLYGLTPFLTESLQWSAKMQASSLTFLLHVPLPQCTFNQHILHPGLREKMTETLANKCPTPLRLFPPVLV